MLTSCHEATDCSIKKRENCVDSLERQESRERRMTACLPSIPTGVQKDLEGNPRETSAVPLMDFQRRQDCTRLAGDPCEMVDPHIIQREGILKKKLKNRASYGGGGVWEVARSVVMY